MRWMLFWKLIGEVCSESPYFTTCCFGTMLISYLFRWTLFDRYQPMHSQVLLKRRLFQTISSLISFFYSSVTFVWQRRWVGGLELLIACVRWTESDWGHAVDKNFQLLALQLMIFLLCAKNCACSSRDRDTRALNENWTVHSQLAVTQRPL